jgi:hypothetical protein
VRFSTSLHVLIPNCKQRGGPGNGSCGCILVFGRYEPFASLCLVLQLLRELLIFSLDYHRFFQFSFLDATCCLERNFLSQKSLVVSHKCGRSLLLVWKRTVSSLSMLCVLLVLRSSAGYSISVYQQSPRYLISFLVQFLDRNCVMTSHSGVQRHAVCGHCVSLTVFSRFVF